MAWPWPSQQATYRAPLIEAFELTVWRSGAIRLAQFCQVGNTRGDPKNLVLLTVGFPQNAWSQLKVLPGSAVRGERLMHAEKLSAVGELVAGIVHEVRTSLQPHNVWHAGWKLCYITDDEDLYPCQIAERRPGHS